MAKVVETSPENRLELSVAFINTLAGTVGGMAGVISGHPFDTIKVRLQSQAIASGQPNYRGTWHCFTSIIRNESIFGLFKGMASPLVGVTLVNAALFGVYGSLLNMQLDSPTSSPTLSQIFVAGAGAGFLNSAISCPMELVKIQLQNQRNLNSEKVLKFSGPVDCTRKIYRYNGIKGLYRGITPTIWREWPSYGVYFASYELMCKALTRPGETVHDLDGIRLMLAGGIGGVASWLATYPCDMVKTLMQSEHLNTPQEKRYKSSWECFTRHYKQDGASFFFRGLNATIIRAFPTNACTFAMYTLTLRALMPYMKKDDAETL